MTKENKKASGWTYKDSAREYGIERWSSNYFGISEDGEVVVKAPTANGEQQVSLKKIAKDLEERGLDMPVLVRLDNLVDARINELNLGFASAIKSVVIKITIEVFSRSRLTSKAMSFRKLRAMVKSIHTDLRRVVKLNCWSQWQR